ncbi:cysteine desulfurase family protein [Moraxella canis]|uniref:cysteine desulfurase family protein n=1 Tax=Moraxella canis TaxID=90239 RepID=UPI0012FEC4DF|nr:cysteine desulfurase family protein [Moraxella canis]
MSTVYLDYNASTPCDERVVQAMNPYWSQFGNPHSSHTFGYQKQKLIDECLEKLSIIYNCLPDDIVFTSGATEANNLSIFSGIKLAKSKSPHKNVILTSHLEHKSVIEPLIQIARQLHLSLIYINLTKDGLIDCEDFQEKLEQHQVLWASVCMTNGEIGTNQPIKELAAICHNHGVNIHVDASQAGYCDLDYEALGVDYLTISGHKIYGPSGIGLMISKHLQDEFFEPMIYGGGQQYNKRSGTVSLPLIIGLTTAIEILNDEKDREKERLVELRDYLYSQLKSHFQIEVHGSMQDRHPANLHLSMQGIDALTLLNNMQPHAAFSLGSACNGLNREYSGLMKGMSISRKQSESSFRMTVGRFTTKEEIDYVVNTLCSLNLNNHIF